jgi:hypothetical protein
LRKSDAFTDGPFWAEQRRFATRHLKEFGFGKKNAEDVIFEETGELAKELKKKIFQVSKGFYVQILLRLHFYTT